MSSTWDLEHSIRNSESGNLSTSLIGECFSSLYQREGQRRCNQNTFGGRSWIDRFGGGRTNPVFQFPIEMSLRKHELLDLGEYDSVYITVLVSVAKCLTNNLAFNDELCKDFWLDTWRLSSADPALLNQLLYWSTLYIRCLQSPEKRHEPTEAVIYYARSVSIINARLQNTTDVPGDDTIRTIVMLLFYNVRT
jgi:hypothetical protein